MSSGVILGTWGANGGICCRVWGRGMGWECVHVGGGGVTGREERGAAILCRLSLCGIVQH